MRFVRVDAATGAVLGVCRADRLGEILPAEGEALFLADSYVTLRSVSDEELVEQYTYNHDTNVWECPQPEIPVEEARASKLNEIKGNFNAALLEGYTTSSSIKLDADFDSISRLNALRSFAELAGVEVLTIRDFNNVTHDVTPAALTTMLLELGVNTQALYKKKWDLQDAVNAAATTAEVNAFHW